CSLPHVGCGAIVNDSLVRLHAAPQNNTGGFTKAAVGPTANSAVGNVYRCTPPDAATCPTVARAMRPLRRKARISARPRLAPQVAQDFAGGIAARQTGDAAAGVRARAAQVQA